MSKEDAALFTDNVTLKSGNPGSLNVRLGARGLGDERAAALASFLDTLLAGAASKGNTEALIFANVDLSENAISDKGLTAVLDALSRGSVTCRCLKLHKNRISEGGGARLAEMIKTQRETVEELHLSHNQLTAKSLVQICMAIQKNDNYPAKNERSWQFVPCWLRMEQNLIAKPLELLDLLRREGSVSFCMADNRDLCGPWRCVCSSQNKTDAPRIHIFAIANSGRGAPTSFAEKEMCDIVSKWGGVRMKSANAGARLPVSKSAAPSPATRGAGSPAGVWGNSTPAGNSPGVGVWGNPALGATQQKAIPGAGVVPEKVRGPAPGSVWGNPISSGGQDFTPASRPAAEDKAQSKQQSPPPPPTAGQDAVQTANATNTASQHAAPLSAAAKPVPTAPQAQVATAIESPAVAIVPNAPVSKSPPAAVVAATTVTTEAQQPVSQPKPQGTSVAAADSSGIRIRMEQLESEGAQFICPLCSFVLTKPVFTTCSHMLCEACLRPWVARKVQEQKAQAEAGGGNSQNPRVNLIPCPHANCNAKLRRQDIQSLDNAKESVGPAILCARIFKKLQVRCVHHEQHFKLPMGADAKRLAEVEGIRCRWCGDREDYENHINKTCEVQLRLDGVGVCAKESVTALPPKQVAGEPVQPVQAVQPVAQSRNEPPPADEDDAVDLRIVKHNYTPVNPSDQIALKKGDLVQVYEVTESGWAAGILKDKKTMTDIGEAGWFPIGYVVEKPK